ncbi:GntR family transcriptional regulator [Pseudoclavibacter terrae]|uniref:GntR family transcriptional regulator n=1 Tax=Pseudoclavibacter terrae TaxID=1530195 RepID=A0A7J5AXB7_9MICO|nr:GntR family transcriptional regulator [Pseudoclavibacter terrae]KAB1636096.1 GntR family transcriptional regulator [Pseudoclavibacter terrae]
MPVQLTTVSVVDAVAEQLRNQILSGAIVPGNALTEGSVTEQFGVPRPSVRSALQVLTFEGLLRREPNKSVFVPRLGAEDVRDIFGVRRVVEEEAARRFVRLGRSSEVPERLLLELEAMDERAQWSDVVRVDFDFHKSIVDAVDSPRLSRIYQSIATETRLALSQLRPSYDSPIVIASEHRSLLDHIRSGDERSAIEATREHLALSERIILSEIAQAEQGSERGRDQAIPSPVHSLHRGNRR